MLKSVFKKFWGYYKIIVSSFSFAIILTFGLYVFSLFPNESITFKLIPVCAFCIFLFSLFLYCLVIESKDYQKRIIDILRKNNILKLSGFITIVLFALVYFVITLINSEGDFDIVESELVDVYLEHENNYWDEIVRQFKGPLLDKTSQFPDFYKNAGNMLIFSAKDGLVSIILPHKFKFNNIQFDKWLRSSEEYGGPQKSVINSSLDGKFSITQWVQVFSGNGIKIAIDDVVPNNFIIGGNNFPKFPPINIYNPKTNSNTPMTIITLNIQKDSLKNLGLNLRDIEVQNITQKSKTIKPFLWRQLEIYGTSALSKLNPLDAKLKASRELNSVLAGMNLGIENKILNSNPIGTVIQKLEMIIVQFENLLHLSDGNTKSIKNFLSNNPILVIPDYLNLVLSGKLNKETNVDFIFVKSTELSSECILVDLEPATNKPFVKGGDPTSEFWSVLKKTANWRIWLRENALHSQKLNNIKNLHSDSKIMIIIGRGKNSDKAFLKNLETIQLNLHDNTEILTYDNVLSRAKRFVNNLKEY